MILTKLLPHVKPRKLLTDFMKTTEKPDEHHSPDSGIAKTYQGT